MDILIPTETYAAVTILLFIGIALVWLGVEKQRAEDRRVVMAERLQDAVNTRVREILDQEAASIAAARRRSQDLTEDAHWQHIRIWLADLLRTHDVFASVSRGRFGG